MIDNADAELRAWLEPLLGTAKLSFETPPLASSGTDETLSVHLFEIERPATVASGRTPPIELRLGYLVTAWGGDAATTHALLGRVLAAALTQAQYELEFGDAVSRARGTASGPIRPGFVVRVRTTQDRGIAQAPLVREVPRIETEALSSLAGIVTATDGTPIPGATLEIETLARVTSSGSDGRFVFAGIPKSVAVAVRVRAKGKEVNVTRAASAPNDDLHITIPL